MAVLIELKRFVGFLKHIPLTEIKTYLALYICLLRSSLSAATRLFSSERRATVAPLAVACSRYIDNALCPFSLSSTIATRCIKKSTLLWRCKKCKSMIEKPLLMSKEMFSPELGTLRQILSRLLIYPDSCSIFFCSLSQYFLQINSVLSWFFFILTVPQKNL